MASVASAISRPTSTISRFASPFAPSPEFGTGDGMRRALDLPGRPSHNRAKSQGRVAATLLAAATAFVAVQIVLTGIDAALAHSLASDSDPDVVRALFNLSWVLDMLAALPGAVFVLTAAVGLMRTQAIPGWLSWAGIGVAGLFLLRSTTWARDGFWSPTGDYLFILIPLGLLWILISSIVLVRNAPTTTEQPAAPPT